METAMIQHGCHIAARTAGPNGQQNVVAARRAELCRTKNII